MGGREGFRACANEIHVGALVQDEAGGLDGIAEVFDTGYAACAESGAVHEQGIELDGAFGGEETTAAGVEGGIVLEDGDCGLYGIGGGASPVEDGVAGFEGLSDPSLVIRSHFRRDGPGSAVDDEGRFGGVREHGDLRTWRSCRYQ